MSLYKDAENRLWFEEELYSDTRQKILVSRVVFEKITSDDAGNKLQDVKILATPRYGLMLTIDGVVQFTEEDEAYYHEPLVHCGAMSRLTAPRRVLLIGCDGGTLREVVKYDCLEVIDVVDIDRVIIESVKLHVPSISRGAFDDRRVRLTIEDGAIFVKRKREEAVKYDLIIIDSPDPIGPAMSLFSTTFYLDVAAILAPDGIMMRQTGSSVLQPDEMPTHVRQMQELFPNGDVQPFMTAVATYAGGYFMLVGVSHQKGIFKEALRELNERVKYLSPETMRWYSAETHRGAMAIPPEVGRLIEQSEFGRQIIIDLYRCNYDIISSKEEVKRFLRELCDEIGMKPFGDPIVPDFGHGKSRTSGLSGVQLIETSSLDGHFSNHWRLVCMDVFTCSALGIEKAVKKCMNFFEAQESKWRLEIRGDRLNRLPETLKLHRTFRDGDRFRTKTAVYAPVGTEEMIWEA